MHPYSNYREDVRFCCQIHKNFGKSFYWGTKILSPAERDATCVLYAFFRYPDEIVDTQFAGDKVSARQALLDWRYKWKRFYRGQTTTLPVDEEKILRATKYVFDFYHIPFEYSLSFLSAMSSDAEDQVFLTYSDLEKYMYGSAVVVGYMMTYILYHNHQEFFEDDDYRQSVLEGARALGEAFQLTNFIRDIKEDLDLRGRVYLPKEDLDRFNVKVEDLNRSQITDQIRDLIRFEIDRTKGLYQKADWGIELLPNRSRSAIYLARVLYSGIAAKIEKKDFDVFSTRVRLGLMEKLWLFFRVIMQKSYLFGYEKRN